MKQLGKSLLIGLLAGAVELAAAGLLAGVGKAASFEDLAFGLALPRWLWPCFLSLQCAGYKAA